LGIPGFLNVQLIVGALLILCLVAALALVVYDGLSGDSAS
jgi:hypothetical protein